MTEIDKKSGKTLQNIPQGFILARTIHPKLAVGSSFENRDYKPKATISTKNKLCEKSYLIPDSKPRCEVSL